MTRLMCSQDRREVEFLKRELFRAGIRTEVRSNPVAEAFGVMRLELWLHNDRDYLDASKRYAVIRDNPVESDAPKDSDDAERPANGAKAPVNHRPTPEAEVVDVDAQPAHKPGDDGVKTKWNGQANELEQARMLLEQEVEQMLARETEMAAKCASLQDRVKQLNEALDESKAQVAREARDRIAAEKKAAEASTLKAAFDREVTARKSAEEQLRRETEKVSAELAREKEARLAAEENAGKMAAARDALAQQAADQNRQQQELQSELDQGHEQLQAYLGSLNALRSKLQAKKRY